MNQVSRYFITNCVLNVRSLILLCIVIFAALASTGGAIVHGNNPAPAKAKVAGSQNQIKTGRKRTPQSPVTIATQIGQNSEDGVWTDIKASAAGNVATDSKSVPRKYRSLRLNPTQLKGILDRAPIEFTDEVRTGQVIVTLPMPDGSYGRFSVSDSPVMSARLAAQFPEIKTYSGQGIDDQTATARFDWTPAGFHAVVLSAGKSVYIDPVSRETGDYLSYFTDDATNGDVPNCEGVLDPGNVVRSNNRITEQLSGVITPNVVSGGTLRTYRLAVAATGEFSVAYGNGTVAGTIAAITTIVTRVNAIYEREVAIRFQLIADETPIIYLDGTTDPYTNGDTTKMIGENQTNLTNSPGLAAFDIGHVFGTNSGGLASLGVVCSTNSKARGVSGVFGTLGSVDSIKLIAHEMGHQFSANHTFNGTSGSCNGNRAAVAAYEPGAGVTIMSYSGTCDVEDYAPYGSDFFHIGSLESIITYSVNNTCYQSVATGNTPPTVSAGASYTIPQSTPFTLTASGSDPDGDPITFSWEEFDLGTASPPNTDDGSRPIFRSYQSVTSPSRTFPKLADILSNTPVLGESLPTTTRTMNFKVTARDNRAGGGGTTSAAMQVNVRSDAGPFVMTQPVTNVSWSGGSSHAVTWNVANTAGAPVSADNVRILLSTDGGNTFPTTVVASAPNNGSATIVVPNTPTTTARIKVEALGNIFFSISPANFTIVQGTTCDYTVNPLTQQFSLSGGSNSVIVTTNGGCPWTATSNDSFITITGGASGTGNGTVNYQVSSNPGAPRSGTMTIAGKLVTINEAGSDFSITAIPGARSLKPGSSTGFDINKSITSGLSQNVALSVSGQPADTSIDLSPSTVVSGNSAHLTVNVGSTATPGNYTLTITGATSSASHSTTVGLTVQQASPLAVLSVDDGSYEGSLGPSGGGTVSYVNRLTPASYPSTLVQIGIYFGQSIVGSNATLLIGKNPGGTSNVNSVVFQTVDVSITAGNQITYFNVPPSTITSGDFVVGFRMTSPSGSFPCAYDTNQPLNRRSYFGNPGSFTIIDDLSASFSSNFSIRARLTPTLQKKKSTDYDNDGKTDFSVWRPGPGTWYVVNSSNSSERSQQWGSGALGDVIVPGDYSGDGKTDFAVWRASSGTWFVLNNATGSVTTQQWGSQAAGDVPVAGDYDGDGITDFAVWRGSTGTWYIINSSNASTTVQQWGNQSLGDVPVPGDYDGDGVTDFAVWRASTGTWYVLNSSTGFVTIQQFGSGALNDKPVPGDYDGDRRTDFAVWRPGSGTWYVMNSSTGQTVQQQWGSSALNDVPVPGDYDSDGKSDFAVWRPGTGIWYVIKSSDGSTVQRQWGSGALNDQPVPGH